MARPRKVRSATFSHFADHVADIARVALGVQHAAFEPRHVEEIGVEAGQARRLFLDRGIRRSSRLAALIWSAKLAQAGDGADDRGQRRAQMMRERGEQHRDSVFALLQRRRFGASQVEQGAVERSRGLVEQGGGSRCCPASRVGAVVGLAEAATPIARAAWQGATRRRYRRQRRTRFCRCNTARSQTPTAAKPSGSANWKCASRCAGPWATRCARAARCSNAPCASSTARRSRIRCSASPTSR